MNEYGKYRIYGYTYIKLGTLMTNYEQKGVNMVDNEQKGTNWSNQGRYKTF